VRAFVGQQVQYRLRILRRRDVGALEWQTPLSFPTFRVEGLPAMAGDDRVERGGETYLVFVERRALFPASAGRLVIPAAGLRCDSPDGSEIALIPALSLEVEALPEKGRPRDFGGLLGPVAVSATASPESLALGGSLHLSVMLQGDTNLWNAPSPRAALDRLADVEVFEHPPELARDQGRRLVLRRYFSFDLVPRAAGRLHLPEIRIPYFDPATRRYGEARAGLEPIVVTDAAPAAAQLARDLEPLRPPAEPRSPAARLPLRALLALAAAAALVALAAERRRRVRAEPSDARARSLLDAARAAALRGDAGASADAAGRALRAALSGPAALSGEELARQAPPGPRQDAARLLLRIEHARFAPGGTPPDLAEVEAALARLRELRPAQR
jgi:hypothetical protein